MLKNLKLNRGLYEEAEADTWFEVFGSKCEILLKAMLCPMVVVLLSKRVYHSIRCIWVLSWWYKLLRKEYFILNKKLPILQFWNLKNTSIDPLKDVSYVQVKKSPQSNSTCLDSSEKVVSVRASCFALVPLEQCLTVLVCLLFADIYFYFLSLYRSKHWNLNHKPTLIWSLEIGLGWLMFSS